MSQFTQDDVDRIVSERLAAAKAKYEARIAELVGQAKEAEDRAKAHAEAAARLPEIERELTSLKTASERAAVWDAAGVPAELRPRLERLYEADTADEAKPLSDWLESVRESDPVVSRVLHGVQPPSPANGQPAAPQGTAKPSAGSPRLPPGQAPAVRAVDVSALRRQRAELTAAGKHDEARAVFAQILASGESMG